MAIPVSKPAKGISPSMPMIAPGSAKAALEAAGMTKGGQFYSIPVDNIKVIPGFNVRVDNEAYQTKLAELIERIDNEGFLNTKPLAGFAGKDEGGTDVIFLTDGHRRLAAVKKLNEQRAEAEPPQEPIPTLPMILKPASTDMKALTIALVTENSGEKLSALEQAVVVRRLLKAEMKPAAIAVALQMTEKWVGHLMVLINSPKEIRDLVKADKITGSEAIRIMLSQREKVKDEAGAIIKGKFSYDKPLETIQKIVKRAADKGAPRATRKDTDEGTKGGTVTAGVKMVTNTIVFESVKDAKHDFSEIARFAALFDDDTWYKKTNAAGTKIKLLEDVKFSCKIARPKKEEPTDEAPPATPAPPKKTTAAKKTAAAPAVPPVEVTSTAATADIDNAAADL